MSFIETYLYELYLDIPVWALFRHTCMSFIETYLYELYWDIHVWALLRHTCMSFIETYLYELYWDIPVWALLRQTCMSFIKTYMYELYWDLPVCILVVSFVILDIFNSTLNHILCCDVYLRFSNTTVYNLFLCIWCQTIHTPLWVRQNFWIIKM